MPDEKKRKLGCFHALLQMWYLHDSQGAVRSACAASARFRRASAVLCMGRVLLPVSPRGQTYTPHRHRLQLYHYAIYMLCLSALFHCRNL